MKTQYIEYTELIKRQEHLKTIQEKGFKLLYRKNRFKICLGIGCLIIAVIPNGLGVFLYPVGLMLLGLSLKDVDKFKDNLKFKYWLLKNK